GPTSAIADVYRYDTKRNTWSKLTTLPDGARGGAAVAVIGDALYVAGGARPRPGETTSDTVSSLEIFDLRRGTWSQGPNLPTARTHVGGVALGGYFYVLGGSSIAGFGGELLRTVERYDPRTSQWQMMPDMPRVHWAFGVTTLGAKIVVLGGVGAGGL